MKRSLIFLYGLPGVGKLTIAKELCKTLKCPLYHSHLTSDLVYSVFPRGEVGSKLKQKIRNDVIGAWARDLESSLVTTLLYKKGKSGHYFEEITDTVTKYGVEVFYFHLICSITELKSRLLSEDRKKFDKLVDWKAAKKKMNEFNMTDDVPFENNFTIDTTDLSPEESAKRILKEI